ncbi:hypothetical protein CNR22_17345 [Sphingobacteriaceae bacterium]|nr:hypothetical protein CNR22_17345 [Sphingobacteriaceae bacterium]
MMKKLLFSLITFSLISTSLLAQDPASKPSKVRFGLRVSPQPTWFTSGDKNATPNGAKFGFGFGLNLEFRMSDVASFLTGIGGDFEGGKYTFRNDPVNNYQVTYLLDESNVFVAPNNKTDGTNNKQVKSNTAFILEGRTVKTSYVTIPIMLKLSTKEYSGFKYFGMFGGELGIRLKATAEDSYLSSGKFDSTFTYVPTSGASSQTDIDVSKDFAPLRLCFNAGLGAEYRIAGSTSVFININYFRSLLNQTKSESEYTFYKTEASSGKSTFIKQNLKASGIRINVGILF